MDPFLKVTGIVAPLLRGDIDTDQIAPGRVILNLGKAGAGAGLFANWRFHEDGSEDPDFILNRQPFRHATFLLAGANFGCGSSREYAVWALRDFGIRAVLAPSFGSIFAGNCISNGVLPLSLAEGQIAAIADEIATDADSLTIDLLSCRLTSPRGRRIDFSLPERPRTMLLKGLDVIDLTLECRAAIDAYQNRDALLRPWIYATGSVRTR